MRRRTFLRLMAASGVVMAQWPSMRDAAHAARSTVDARRSLYGVWTVRDGLPAFAYVLDQDAEPAAEWDPVLSPPTRRNWVMLGNRAIRLQAANDGTVALFDESEGLRWLVAPEPGGTGVSLVDDDDGARWGSAFAMRGGDSPPRRTFGPTWFEVADVRGGLSLTRTIRCLDGEVPWLIVQVVLTLARDAARPRAIRHVEQWRLRPRFLTLFETATLRRTRGDAGVAYDVRTTRAGLVATERFAGPSDPGAAGAAARYLIGTPAALVLERLGGTRGEATHRLD